MAKILIIDDEVATLDSETTVLEKKNFSISSITEWDNISEYINGIIPDLILLDISLNSAYIRAICKQLKTNTVTKKIPIILFSGNFGVEKTAHNYLADGFISKPFKTADLLEIIDGLKKSISSNWPV